MDDLAHAHDELDVVLDEKDGETLLRQLEQQVAEDLGLLRVEAGPGLVQEKQARVGGQRPGQLDEARQAGGHGVDPLGGRLGDADPLEDLLGDLLRVRPVLGPTTADLGGNEHVLPRRQRAEHLEALERSGQPQAGALVGLAPGDVFAVDQHLARRRLLQAGDDVEQRRLAGAVGADEAGDPTWIGGEIDVLQGHHAAETDADLLNRQERQRGPPPR